MINECNTGPQRYQFFYEMSLVSQFDDRRRLFGRDIYENAGLSVRCGFFYLCRMKRLERLFKHSLVWRLLVFLFFAARDVRVHPGVRFLARLNQLKAGAGTKISNDVRFVLGPTGQCVIGVGCWLEDGVEIHTDSVIEIGMGTTIRRNSAIHGSVHIGEHCIFAPNVFISSGSHIYKAWPELTIREQEKKYYSMPEQSRPRGFEERPVIVEDDCWLGINVVVMPGVTIGKGSVLGANSVVTKSLPPYSLAVGIPARVIGNRFDYAQGGQ